MSATRQQGADNLRHALAALDPEATAPLDDRAKCLRERSNDGTPRTCDLKYAPPRDDDRLGGTK